MADGPLSDFEAEFITHGGEKAILMLCPLDGCNHSIVIPFNDTGTNTPKVGNVWRRMSGSILEDITLSPSYHLPKSCGLHGHVKGGRWVGC